MINSQMTIAMDFPRDRSCITSLGRQICPSKCKFLHEAYDAAVRDRDYGYLVLDCHPKHKKYAKLWLRSHLFPSDECRVFIE